DERAPGSRRRSLSTAASANPYGRRGNRPRSRTVRVQTPENSWSRIAARRVLKARTSSHLMAASISLAKEKNMRLHVSSLPALAIAFLASLAACTAAPSSENGASEEIESTSSALLADEMIRGLGNKCLDVRGGS